MNPEFLVVLLFFALIGGFFFVIYVFLLAFGIVGPGSTIDGVFEEHRAKNSPQDIGASLVGIVEDNLKPNVKAYPFEAICYRETNKAIMIDDDIWLPKSQIRIEWGQTTTNDETSVKLTIPVWLAEKVGLAP